jgi:hypothetical protein
VKNLPAAVAFACVVTLAFWPGPAGSLSAQRGRGGRGRPAPPSPLLESITSLTCAFTASSVATWLDGEPQVQVNPASAGLTLAITNIDTQEETARIADAGLYRDVSVKLAGSNLHVLDARPDGTLRVTTVFAQESREGRLKAVHSRVPDSSQYYGDCAFTRSYAGSPSPVRIR